MRRTKVSPYGQSTSMMRLVSMIMALLVLWMLYDRFKDPATWRILDDGPQAHAATPPNPAAESEPEDLVPGPNDLDENEVEAAKKSFEFVTDRAQLKPVEMTAYWKLMSWSRSQPFAELEQRAETDVPFRKLWEQPELHRGELIQLRLHVRQVVEWDSPENPSNTKKVYEVWGWTDESRSFPYLVVIPALDGLPIGTDIRAEIVFVGYFLKIMSYTAFDNPRGAPLLIGRARLIEVSHSPVPVASDGWMVPVVIGAGILVIGLVVWLTKRKRVRTQVQMLPSELRAPIPSSDPDFDNLFSQIDSKPPADASELATTFAPSRSGTADPPAAG